MHRRTRLCMTQKFYTHKSPCATVCLAFAGLISNSCVAGGCLAFRRQAGYHLPEHGVLAKWGGLKFTKFTRLRSDFCEMTVTSIGGYQRWPFVVIMSNTLLTAKALFSHRLLFGVSCGSSCHKSRPISASLHSTRPQQQRFRRATSNS